MRNTPTDSWRARLTGPVLSATVAHRREPMPSSICILTLDIRLLCCRIMIHAPQNESQADSGKGLPANRKGAAVGTTMVTRGRTQQFVGRERRATNCGLRNSNCGLNEL